MSSPKGSNDTYSHSLNNWDPLAPPGPSVYVAGCVGFWESLKLHQVVIVEKNVN